MYNNKIDTRNKIISADDILEIVAKMNEKLIHFQNIYKKEEAQNQMLEYHYRTWTFKDYNSGLSFNVDFYDDTNVKIDNYGEFLTVFNSRLRDIKSIDINFYLSYSVKDEFHDQSYNQHITMYLTEKRADIDVSLSSEDKRIDDVYELIKNKVINAPEKYDKIIKKKSTITTVISAAIGFIPGIIIATALLFVEPVRTIFAESYVLYPICCVLIGFVIGGTIANGKLDMYYENIMPDKKYAGYDYTNNKSIYKDDIDTFTDSSDILIGKKVNNLTNRKIISEMYDKYKRFIPYEVVIILIMSLIAIVVGKIF